MNCECDSYDEENEEGGHGHSSKTPWELRGIEVSNVTMDTDWESAWKTLGKHHSKFDPVQQAADFYLLEALSANMPALDGSNHIKKIPYVKKTDLKGLFGDLDIDTRLIADTYQAGKSSVEKNVEQRIGLLMGEAEAELMKLVEHADKVLIEYFHMACAGEARHHRAVGGRILSGSSNRSAAWVGWKTIYKKIGNESLMDLYKLFLEFDDGSYGGQLWADACEVLYERLEGNLGPDEFTNKKMFVDRAWTLEHNGGCFLNKIGWGIINEKGWHLDWLKSKVLDAHASNPTNYKQLLKVASKKVVKLYTRYYDLQNKYRKLNGLELVTNFVTEPSVTYTVCKHCGSDATKGHLMACAGKTKFLTHNIEEDETDGWNVAAIKYEKYPVNAKGDLVAGKYLLSGSVSAANHHEGTWGWSEQFTFKAFVVTVKDGDEIDILALLKKKLDTFLKKHKVVDFKNETYVSIVANLTTTGYDNWVGYVEAPYNLTFKKGKLMSVTHGYNGTMKPKNYSVGLSTEQKAKKAKAEIVYTYNLERKTLEPSNAKVITVESKVK